MKNNLLSIFPLNGLGAYARLSCLPIADSAIAPAPPVLRTRPELICLLEATSMNGKTQQAMTHLDFGETVQVLVSNQDVLLLGLQSKEEGVPA